MSTEQATEQESVTGLTARLGDELSAKRRAVVEAQRVVRTHEDTMLKELRFLLSGMVVVVDGSSYTAERLGQDGYEHYQTHIALQGERLVVKQLFMVQDPRRRYDNETTPLVYAYYEEAYVKHQRCGEVSFLLRDMRDVAIIGPAPERA